MRSHKLVLQQIGIVALGVAVPTALMIVVFAVLGYYDTSVLLGGIAGALIATANFFLMALSTSLAADKAQQQDVKGGQALIQLSYIGRMLGLFLVLILLAKSGYFHVIPLAVPLIFVRPALTIAEIFKKKGENAA